MAIHKYNHMFEDCKYARQSLKTKPNKNITKTKLTEPLRMWTLLYQCSEVLH